MKQSYDHIVQVEAAPVGDRVLVLACALVDLLDVVVALGTLGRYEGMFSCNFVLDAGTDFEDAVTPWQKWRVFFRFLRYALRGKPYVELPSNGQVSD